MKESCNREEISYFLFYRKEDFDNITTTCLSLLNFYSIGGTLIIFTFCFDNSPVGNKNFPRTKHSPLPKP